MQKNSTNKNPHYSAQIPVISLMKHIDQQKQQEKHTLKTMQLKWNHGTFVNNESGEKYWQNIEGF